MRSNVQVVKFFFLSLSLSSEDNLQFVFKYIDPNDEEKPFVFTVSINNQGIYSGNVVSK